MRRTVKTIILLIVMTLGVLVLWYVGYDHSQEGDAVSALHSGIAGIVLVGPTCPVMRADEPCPDKPLQTTLSVQEYDRAISATTRIVAHITSDSEGRFSVDLPPGEYIIGPDDTGVMQLPRCEKSDLVDVMADKYASTVISCDSGIR